MRGLILVSALAAVAAPTAAFAERTEACEEEERATPVERAAPTAAPIVGGAVTRPAPAQREAAEQTARNERRRSGKRIPDAELIGPRGAL